MDCVAYNLRVCEVEAAERPLARGGAPSDVLMAVREAARA